MARLAGLALAFALTSPARAEEAQPEEPARAGLSGFRISWRSGFTYQAVRSNVIENGVALVPNDINRATQEFTLVFSAHLGYGFPLGPFVLSLGGNVPSYFFDGNTTLGLLGEAELHLPIRWFSPYVLVGGGGALAFASPAPSGGCPRSNMPPSATYPCGVNGYGVFRGGGGLMVFPGSWIGLGFQAAYFRFDQSEMVELTWPLELRF